MSRVSRSNYHRVVVEAKKILRARREALNMSALELGVRVGVSQPAISRMEIHGSSVFLDMFIAYCVALKISPAVVIMKALIKAGVAPMQAAMDETLKQAQEMASLGMSDAEILSTLKKTPPPYLLDGSDVVLLVRRLQRERQLLMEDNDRLLRYVATHAMKTAEAQEQPQQ